VNKGKKELQKVEINTLLEKVFIERLSQIKSLQVVGEFCANKSVTSSVPKKSIWIKISAAQKLVPYVHSKFVPQEAVGIYYIPWPSKKIAAQNSYTNLSARNSQKLCSLHSQLSKAAKKPNFKRPYYMFF